MADGIPPAGGARLTIRLIGLKPGASQDVIVQALSRIYKGKGEDQVRRALARLPLVLARTATEDQARRLSTYLEAKGAILEVNLASPEPTLQPTSPPPPPPPSQETETQTEPIPSGVPGRPREGERRAKPRIHPGIQLQPMSFSEILDRSFRMLRQRFWLFFLILLIPQGIAFLFGKLVQFLLLGDISPELDVITGAGFGISVFLAVVVFLLLQIWAQGALIHAVSETYLGHRTTVKASFRAMRHRIGRLLGTLILMWILIMLGSLVFIIPGLILFVIWLMTDKVVVLEGEKGMQAMRRSRELMRTRTEPGFWKGPKMKAGLILAVGFVIGMVIRLLFQIPGEILGLVIPDSVLVMTLKEALNTVSSSLATTYVAIAMILYYYDIRIRKEGFDLKMMAEGL